ncbi:DUF5028 domain-containing protein [Olsenella sp. AM30-3LB]|uniref:DUF5028 domain-containing protein n=1 Tax=Olsenella sp. AM30-3LB TaxID=2292359 RepID=UPI000E4DA81A|nr:DUF5028 domain-containing protein [Olsenella sp. AM30-3LB]RHD74851.1 DUF5028 domain-containing protein [Olsenella sp. AM30-3LB]
MRRANVALGILGLSIVLAAIALRIHWVNTNLPEIPVEYYQQGEWVSLGGAFQVDSGEGTDGYSLLVEKAELTTYDEFLQEHGVEEGTVQRQPEGTHGSARCVVDLELRIRNEGNADGSLDVFQMILVPERGNEYLICDVMNQGALWPQTQPGAGMQVSIRPGTEYVAHIPYVFNGLEGVYFREVTDTDFSLLVSRMPERKMIRVQLS